MAKSSRRKKQDRAKALAKRAEQERRRAKAERQRQIAEYQELLTDPVTRPADVARVLAAEFPDQVLAADMMAIRGTLGVPAEDIAETARLLLEGAAPERPGLGALAVAALAAHLEGDEDAEHEYAREMLARADDDGDPGARLSVMRSATVRDHPGETCELIEPYLREYPDDESAAHFYARALEAAFAQAAPGELETAALARYGDGSAADALDRAVREFAERTPWGAAIRKWTDEELAGSGSDRWRSDEREATAGLLTEIAVSCPFTEFSGEAGSEAEDAIDTLLRSFAADPGTPAGLAALAAERDQRVHYGIWQLADPSPSPGVWCTDLVSGTRRYAWFPAEVIDGAPPWSVWLGALAPADGIWRAGRAGIWLSPVEGDAVAEYAEDAVWRMLHDMAGEPGEYPPPPEQVRFGQAEPFCVRWETGEEPEEGFGNFSSPVVARLAPRLASWVWVKRSTGVRLRNTDQEPMVLIDAEVAVKGDVTERLFERPDFGEEEDGEDGQVVWWGEPADDDFDEPVVLHFHDDGSAHVTGPDDEGLERTVLGRLAPEPGRVRVRVNSQSRLERLLRILEDVGAAPKVTHESRSQPSLDFAWGPAPGNGVPARQWAEDWLGQTVAVLDFHTPRHAAEGGLAELFRLEGLLRQLEYQSALAPDRGGHPVDTDWLRAELGLMTTLYSHGQGKMIL